MTGEERDRKLISAAMRYRSCEDPCRAVYLGSVATYMVRLAVGGSSTGEGFEESLAKASRSQLDRALKECRWVIDYMLEHPTMPCPSCGQVVPANANPASIEVACRALAARHFSIRMSLDDQHPDVIRAVERRWTDWRDDVFAVLKAIGVLK